MELQNAVVSKIVLFADGLSNNRPLYLHAKQHDTNSRYIVATIKEHSGTISVHGLVQLNAKKPDGTYCYSLGTINDDGTITVEIKSQMLSVPGVVDCDISIISEQDTEQVLLTTSTFYIIVDETQYNQDAIESTDEFSTVSESLLMIAQYSESAKQSASAAEEALEQIKELGSNCGECEDRLNELEKRIAELQSSSGGIGVSTNAEKLIFGTNLMTTTPIGNIELDETGQAVIDANGKTVQDVWNAIYVKEKLPSITKPTVVLSSPNSKAYEVGTNVIHTFTTTFNPGNYEYGPETGVVLNSWNITDSEGNTFTEAQGQFPAIVVKDDTKYSIMAIADHSAGATPLTNLKNAYPDGAITAGTQRAESTVTTGFRKSFYGTTQTKEAITSEIVRGLAGSSSRALSNGNTFNIPIPIGATRVIIAYPASLRDLTSVKDVNGMNAEIVSGFTKSLINVNGANDYLAIQYKVYSLEYATANDTANSYVVQI